MSFTKTKENNQQNETNQTGLLGRVMPYIPLIMEEFTGQKMKMSGTIGDILACLQRLEQKFDTFERNCAEQFIHQAEQLNSLQQVTKLVSTEKTQAVHFTNNKVHEIEN